MLLTNAWPSGNPILVEDDPSIGGLQPTFVCTEKIVSIFQHFPILPFLKGPGNTTFDTSAHFGEVVRASKKPPDSQAHCPLLEGSQSPSLKSGNRDGLHFYDDNF